MIEVSVVGLRDAPTIKALCLKTWDLITNVTYKANQAGRPTGDLKSWVRDKYGLKATLDGTTIGCFILTPHPSQHPQVVNLIALATDPNLDYAIQREAGFRLIRAANDAYIAAGTKAAESELLSQSPSYRICLDLGVPLTEGGVNPITREPITHRLSIPLAKVDELLKAQGVA